MIAKENSSSGSVGRSLEAVDDNSNIGFELERRGEPLFKTAAEAIKFAVHSSACEGMTTPSEDIENLWRVARGEISADDLIQQYIAEAIEADALQQIAKLESQMPKARHI